MRANGRPTSSAVSAAFLEHNGFIKKFLSRFFSDRHDIEDVAQEAFLRAYVAEQQKDIERPKAYLFQVAKHVALTKLSRKLDQITDSIEDVSPSAVIKHAPSAETEAAAQQTLGIYCEAVAALPEKCREVYLLRKVHGLAHKEIAQRMSLSVSSVEKYLLKGMLECQAYVNECEGRAPGESVSRKPQYRHHKGTL
jgi:RNA polymerase sigma-70 factor (ECF subfamily)